MLVLSRQRDETIMIGDDIEITIVDIRGDKVRIGINAPKSIPVHRKEVYDAIKRENRAAAGLAPEDLPPKGSSTRPPKGSSTGPPKESSTGPPKESSTGPPKGSSTGDTPDASSSGPPVDDAKPSQDG